MHAVDADEPRATIGRRRLAHADARRRLAAARLGQHHALLAVAGTIAQVVQVPHRDRAQASEARVGEDIALAPQHAHRGRPRQRSHGPVHLGQQRDVSARVAPREGMLGGAVVLRQRLASHPARHQPRHLCAAVAAQALHVGQHRPSIRAPQHAVVQPPQHRLDPSAAALVVLGGAKPQRLRSLQHLPHLLHGAHLHLVHVDHHRFDDRRTAPAGCPSAIQPPLPGPVQAQSSLESRARLQTHTSLEKTASCPPAALKLTLPNRACARRFSSTRFIDRGLHRGPDRDRRRGR